MDWEETTHNIEKLRYDFSYPLMSWGEPRASDLRALIGLSDFDPKKNKQTNKQTNKQAIFRRSKPEDRTT